MDMLKRPDAAELTKTGRFYLQVGYNEVFELGQSAWAGALYTQRQTGGRKRPVGLHSRWGGSCRPAGGDPAETQWRS